MSIILGIYVGRSAVELRSNGRRMVIKLQSSRSRIAVAATALNNNDVDKLARRG